MVGVVVLLTKKTYTRTIYRRRLEPEHPHGLDEPHDEHEPDEPDDHDSNSLPQPHGLDEPHDEHADDDQDGEPKWLSATNSWW